MGLFSKFVKQVLGETADAVAEKEAGKVAEKLADAVSQKLDEVSQFIREDGDGQHPGQAAAQPREEAEEEVTIPGNSWGPTMPLEENQYNFPGTPVQYFEKILVEDFPDCRLEKEVPADSKATVFTLWRGDRQAAVIELLNKNSVRIKRRRDCRQAGIPYTRFYYDAEGWWNTRAYVKDRIQKAMAGEI